VSTKPYKGVKTPRRFDGAEPLRDLTPGAIANEQTFPAIRHRNEISLMGEWVSCSYFQKVASGRRCSCWGANSAPAENCKVCYQTGIVGGWNKVGTAQWVLDPTLPNVQLLNIKPYVLQDGPTVWGLADGALTGSIEVTGSFEGAWGAWDAWDGLHWAGNGTVAHHIKTPASTAWLPLTTTNLVNLFSTPQLFTVRVTLTRPSTGLQYAEEPIFSKLALRVHRTEVDSTEVRCNRPRGTHALALTEMGLLDEWTSERSWWDSTLPSLGSEDWFYDRGRAVRWKVVDVDMLAPNNYLLSWDVTARKVQAFEPMANFPL